MSEFESELSSGLESSFTLRITSGVSEEVPSWAWGKDLLSVDAPADGADLTGEIEVPVPWPGDVAHVSVIQYVTSESFTSFFPAFVLPLDEAQAGQPLVLRPEIGPASNVRIDGIDAATATAVSARPHLTWSAPTLGTPDRYTGAFIDLDSQSRYVFFQTPHTWFVFPPGGLARGRRYAFDLRSVRIRPGGGPVASTPQIELTVR